MNVEPGKFTPMNPKKSLQKVLQEEEAAGKKWSEETTVDLIFRGIQDLDSSINTLKSCVKLSLSSNVISRIPEIQLDRLEILSLGRNKIKSIKGLDYVAKSLKQLWISYNEIEKLDSLKNLIYLEVLYIGNNSIAKIDELNYLAGLTSLSDVVFKGNPFCLVGGVITMKPEDRDKHEIYPEIKKRIPSVKTIDGDLVGGESN